METLCHDIYPASVPWSPGSSLAACVQHRAITDRPEHAAVLSVVQAVTNTELNPALIANGHRLKTTPLNPLCLPEILFSELLLGPMYRLIYCNLYSCKNTTNCGQKWTWNGLNPRNQTHCESLQCSQIPWLDFGVESEWQQGKEGEGRGLINAPPLPFWISVSATAYWIIFVNSPCNTTYCAIRQATSKVEPSTDIKPKSMTRAKVWSEEVEEAYRFQLAGYRDEKEYTSVKKTEVLHNCISLQFRLIVMHISKKR